MRINEEADIVSLFVRLKKGEIFHTSMVVPGSAGWPAFKFQIFRFDCTMAARDLGTVQAPTNAEPAPSVGCERGRSAAQRANHPQTHVQ